MVPEMYFTTRSFDYAGHSGRVAGKTPTRWPGKLSQFMAESKFTGNLEVNYRLNSGITLAKSFILKSSGNVELNQTGELSAKYPF